MVLLSTAVHWRYAVVARIMGDRAPVHSSRAVLCVGHLAMVMAMVMAVVASIAMVLAMAMVMTMAMIIVLVLAMAWCRLVMVLLRVGRRETIVVLQGCIHP